MRSRCGRTPPTGAATLEFLLAFPVLVIGTLAVIEFGLLLIVEHTVTAAAIEGARHAALSGGTTSHAAERVRSVLAVHGLDFDSQAPAASGAGDARVVIESDDPALAGERGNTDIAAIPAGPPLSPGQVRVTVCVPATNPATSRPVPDWLAAVGFSIAGRTITVSTLADRE